MKKRLDIASVIEHYSGTRPHRRMTHCPLHEDKTPSCSVDYDNGLWNCHSCGNGGDGYSMIMLIESCGFGQALALADKHGLDGEIIDSGMETRFGARRARKSGGKKGRGYRPRFARGE